MTRLEIMQSAFEDELQKIAGSMHGGVRSGRKPIGIERMLEKESELPKASDIVKTAFKIPKVPLDKKDAALLVGGALAYHQGRKVKRRYDMGRQMDLQQPF